jgi:hypothetical protein
MPKKNMPKAIATAAPTETLATVPNDMQGLRDTSKQTPK